MRKVCFMAAFLVPLLAVGCGSGSRSSAEDTPAKVPPRPGATSTSSEVPASTTSTVPAAPETPTDLVVLGAVDVPDAPENQLAAVKTGRTLQPLSTYVVLIRNGTADKVQQLEISSTARGTDGSLVGTATSDSCVPAVLQAGQWGFCSLTLMSSIKRDATIN